MARALRFSFVFLLLSFAASSLRVSSFDDSFFNCERIVKNWADSSIENENGEDKLTLRDLLFFLHVPRTGGRTYFHCFLRKLYASAQECPRSYDKLRFDPRKPKCKLVVSHDDYSLMWKLPKERTSVVTIMRDPVERVFSTYEFSVEVAARFLVHANLTSAMEMSRRIRPKSRGVSTLDIWPWKYLVPWMREDLFARRDARNSGRLRRNLMNRGAYNMEDMAMPLHKFIHDPIAHDIMHNGATFQVTGLTNNSYVGEAHEVRHCVRMHPGLGHLVLQVAKRRLDRMLYVGLTEDHKESARMFANMVGAQVLLSRSSSLPSPPSLPSNNNTELQSSIPQTTSQESNHALSSIEDEVPSPTDTSPNKGNMTVGKLMEAYESCIVSLRKSQATRRTLSLKQIAPVNFSKEARHMVPEEVIEQIKSMNRLDMELYNHARSIFMQQQHLMRHLDQQLIFLPQQEQTGTPGMPYGFPLGEVALIFVVVALSIVTVSIALTVRKRTSKLKV